MPRSQSSSSRSSSPKVRTYSNTYKVPASFSHIAPIIPPATHKYSMPTPSPPPSSPSSSLGSLLGPQPQQRSFGEIVKEGFGFGIGNSIAQRIFGRPPVVVENKTVTETTSITPVVPSINSSDSTQKLSYNDCMKQMYEKCMITKSHDECKNFSPFENSSERIPYSKCMSDMYLECSKTNSSENCKKYIL
jgi:hypothetical protein